MNCTINPRPAIRPYIPTDWVFDFDRLCIEPPELHSTIDNLSYGARTNADEQRCE